MAILLGLVALAVEISDNTKAVRSQELGTISETNVARRILLTDPEFSAMYVKSLFNPAEMALEEIQSVGVYLPIRVSVLERTYKGIQLGILEPSDWESELLGQFICSRMVGEV